METEVYTYPNPWASFVMQKRCNTFNIISLAREREMNVEIAMIPVRLATLSFAKKLCQALRTQVFISFFLKIMLLLLVPIGSLVFFKIRLSIVKNFSSFDKGVHSHRNPMQRKSSTQTLAPSCWNRRSRDGYLGNCLRFNDRIVPLPW